MEFWSIGIIAAISAGAIMSVVFAGGVVVGFFLAKRALLQGIGEIMKHEKR
jgi:hypothetical protein